MYSLRRDPVLWAARSADGGQSSQLNPDSLPFSQLHFSTAFLTTVTAVVTEKVATEGRGAEFEAGLSSDSRSDEQNTHNAMSSPDASEEIASVQGRLWQEILDNIKKDVEKQGHIALSMTTAATIAAAALSQQRDSRQDDAEGVGDARADVVVFTCNHNFPRVYFVDVVLPEFQHRMAELVLPVANTTKLLLRFYNKLSGSLPTACPICVYNSIRMEQLMLASSQAGDSNESCRSKAWEIWGLVHEHASSDGHSGWGAKDTRER